MTDTQTEIAQAIKDAIKDHPSAEVRVNPTLPAIPPHIAGNIIELLKRVQVTGMEAIAWMEAYNYVQPFAPAPPAPPQTTPGVPFNGTMKK
jgi:hypothetical protein